MAFHDDLLNCLGSPLLECELFRLSAHVAVVGRIFAEAIENDVTSL